jgi:peptide/nickel transport system permease protein
VLVYAARRLAVSVLLLWLVLTATFAFIHLAPGDPMQLIDDHRVSAAERARLAALYGLDKPLAEQYLVWLGDVLRGDLGSSIVHRRSAAQVLAERLPASFLLAVTAMLVEHVLGIFLGVAAALRPGGFLDRQVRSFSLFLYSVPTFCMALLAIDLLAVRAGLFPINMMRSDSADTMGGAERLLDLLHHLALPTLVIVLGTFGGVARFVRNGLAEILAQDYVRTARAVGVSRLRVLWVHALRNTASPILQRFGVALPGMISSAVVIEVIFSWPGVGRAIYSAILERDYPVILASTVLSGVLVVTCTLLVDLFQAWLDPRVRDAV